MELRACYFDIDGTLLGKDHVIHPRVLQSIERLHQVGVAVGIATGRPWFAAKPIADMIGANAPCMSYSGALLTDPTSDEILSAHYLKQEDVEAVITLAREKGWHLELYDNKHYYVEQVTELAHIHAEYLHELPREHALTAIASSANILKVVMMFEGEPSEEDISLLATRTERTELAIAYGAAHPKIHFVNLTDTNARRTEALSAICTRLGCTQAEIMAFGDGEADIPFLAEVRWGVAMGNAKDIVKQAASYTAASVEDYGVARFLEEFLS
ncbi:MAG: Cof-type HAD-IIB family hydrolase [Bdellovibrionales bacterium]|nr:Cof-type HAD-IIB family hydrolase [Bdellovibrionales bacterium]